MLSILTALILITSGWFAPTQTALLTFGLTVAVLVLTVTARTKTPTSNQALSPDDIDLIKEHPVFFISPWAGRNLSAFLACIQSYVLITLAIFMCIQGEYLSLLIIIPTYLTCATLRPKLDPIYFYREGMRRAGHSPQYYYYEQTLAQIDAILERKGFNSTPL